MVDMFSGCGREPKAEQADLASTINDIVCMSKCTLMMMSTQHMFRRCSKRVVLSAVETFKSDIAVIWRIESSRVTTALPVNAKPFRV